MYSKEHKREIKTLFYTSFGKYMSKNNASTGKIKWLNYPTQVKDIYFRISLETKYAEVYIDLQHQDQSLRNLFYDQFLELKTVFKNTLGQDWHWNREQENKYGKKCARITTTLQEVNLYNKDTWAETFQFFEKHLLNLDVFWSEFKDLFKDLEN